MRRYVDPRPVPPSVRADSHERPPHASVRKPPRHHRQPHSDQMRATEAEERRAVEMMQKWGL